MGWQAAESAAGSREQEGEGGGSQRPKGGRERTQGPWGARGHEGQLQGDHRRGPVWGADSPSGGHGLWRGPEQEAPEDTDCMPWMLNVVGHAVPQEMGYRAANRL